MRLVIISDTHQRHRQLRVPDGDVLIHCGDFTNTGEEHAITDFNAWLMELPHTHKIVIPGNHDLLFEDAWHFASKALLTEATVLNETDITIEGVRFWGSPWTPWYRGWAFNYRPHDAEERWENIPSDTDVLITHGPPFGVMDQTSPKFEQPTPVHIGCPELLRRVQEIKPRLHLFGHIHERSGFLKTPDTTFINAAMAGRKYEMSRQPFIFDIEARKS